MFKGVVIRFKPSLISHRLGMSAYLDDATVLQVVCTGTLCAWKVIDSGFLELLGRRGGPLLAVQTVA